MASLSTVRCLYPGHVLPVRVPSRQKHPGDEEISVLATKNDEQIEKRGVGEQRKTGWGDPKGRGGPHYPLPVRFDTLGDRSTSRGTIALASVCMTRWKRRELETLCF